VPLEVPTPDALKAARQRLGLTQAEVARSAGVSQPLIARIESGSVDPRLSTLTAIVAALNRAERQEVHVRDVMVAPVLTLKAGDSVGEAIRLMRENSISQLPVLQKGVPVGSLSEQSVVQALAQAKDPEALARATVADVMGPPFPTASPDTSVEQASRMLQDAHALLVMERGRLLGIVAKADLLRLVFK
jgi:predicted transcriptional regulator